MKAFENVLEYCLAQIEERDTINSMLEEQKLPTIQYSLSADYGKADSSIWRFR